MEVRQLGRSGLRVGALGLGTMTFGASSTYMRGVTAEDAVARRILDRALDAGVTLIDTANSYSQGRTEELLGQWLGAKRDRIVLAGKCGLPVPPDSQPGPHRDHGLSRAHIIESCEAGLRRLGTDRIDLYQMHLQDTTVPIEETLRTCEDLVRAGKVRYLGCSNYTGYRLTEAVAAAGRLGIAGYASVQTQWSLAVRGAEREVVPAARAAGLGILAWSPLARGFLSGKFRRGEPPPEGVRLTAWKASYAALDTEAGWRALAAVEEIARAKQTSASAVATAWLLAQPGLTGVLMGARTTGQLDENLAAAELRLTPDELDTLDAASAPAWGYPYEFIGQWQQW